MRVSAASVDKVIAISPDAARGYYDGLRGETYNPPVGRKASGDYDYGFRMGERDAEVFASQGM